MGDVSTKYEVNYTWIYQVVSIMRNYIDLTIDDIDRALNTLDADSPRDEWVKYMSAVKSELGEDGKSICRSWSETSPQFKNAEFESTWKSIKQGGGVKVGTIIHFAKQQGFKLDGKREKIPQDEVDRRAYARIERMELEKKQEQWAIDFDFRVSSLSKQWWDLYTPALDHPYLTRKGIKAHKCRVGMFKAYDKQNDSFYDVNPNTLIIPMYDINGLCGFQGVLPEKKEINGNMIDKLFLKGLKKDGRFSFFGKPNGRVIICEGWATGASLHEATGDFVVVAFDKGQLLDKAHIFRGRFPDMPIIIAADHDDSEHGEKYARKVCSIVSNTSYIMPTDKGDFNDVHLNQGLQAVAEYFEEKQLPVFNNQTIDFYSPLPYPADDKGKPLTIIENFEEIVKRIGAVIRYNVIKKDEEILLPGESFTMDNQQNASIARIISRCAQFKFPTGNISDFITYIADQRQYNPVEEWVKSKAWDGKDRLTDFLNTIKPKEVHTLKDGDLLHHVLIKRWMVSAIASALNPNGVSSAGVLVFQGGQGLGKTKWFKSLVPDALDLTKDGLQLRLDDKDSVKEALSYWLVELGELDGTFNKSEMAALKAFLTKASDEMRQAYARKASKFARRTVFFASVNPDKFLKDSTGNRRYWTIACESIDYNHTFDMQQVWAQILDLYNSGYGYYLAAEELEALNNNNEDFNEVDPIDELMQSRLDWTSPVGTWRWTTVTDLLIDIGKTHPSVGDCRKAGATLRKLNDGQTKKSNGKQLLLCPPLEVPRVG